MKSGSGEREQSELRTYLAHIAALLVPGRNVKPFSTVRGEPSRTGDLSAWGEESLRLLIDEGRRKFDQQAARFDRIRQTAQVVLPIGVALLVVVGSELARIRPEVSDCKRYLLYVGWGLSMVAVLVGTLGSAAILVTKASFGTILPTLLTHQPSEDALRELAKSYVEQSVPGEDAVNTKLTLQWWSVFFVVLGGIIFGFLWLVRVVW